MKYKDFKNTETYRTADILEVYPEDSDFEFDFEFPEEKLDEMEIINIEIDYSGYVKVILRDVKSI